MMRNSGITHGILTLQDFYWKMGMSFLLIMSRDKDFCLFPLGEDNVQGRNLPETGYSFLSHYYSKSLNFYPLRGILDQNMILGNTEVV